MSWYPRLPGQAIDSVVVVGAAEVVVDATVVVVVGAFVVADADVEEGVVLAVGVSESPHAAFAASSAMHTIVAILRFMAPPGSDRPRFDDGA
jgi:hypothetical protein